MANFGNSFAEAFEKSYDTSARGTIDATNTAKKQKADQDFELLKEKIAKEGKDAEAATRLANIKNTSINLREQAIKSGVDPKTFSTLTQAIAVQKDPDVAEKILTSAIDMVKSNQKDRTDFKQTMQVADFNARMSFIPEVAKAMADRGVSPADIQSFTSTAAENAKLKAGIIQSASSNNSVVSPSQPQTVATDVPSKSGNDLFNQPLTSKAELVKQRKTEEDKVKAEKGSVAAYRMMQQFGRSVKELEKFDPEIGKEGVGGWLTRKGASVATALDELPETKAFQTQLLPFANGMAREIEGGRITDQDRKVYADSLASALQHPTTTNIRLASGSLIGMLDKGGDAGGAITKQLQQLAKADVDIFDSIIAQILIEFPDMAKDIYGEDYEVID